MESEILIEPALQLVSPEQAKSLQQLGFSYKTKHRYFSSALLSPLDWTLGSKPTGYDVDWNDKEHYGLNDANGWNSISVPSIPFAIKWLLEQKEIHIFTTKYITGWEYQIQLLFKPLDKKEYTLLAYGYCDSHEDGELKGLDRALKYLLKGK
jgi:hypothetical protein